MAHKTQLREKFKKYKGMTSRLVVQILMVEVY